MDSTSSEARATGRLGRLIGLGVAAVLAAQLAWAGPASAAPVTIPGCELTDDEGEPMDLSLTIDTDDPVLDGYADGDYLAIHDWVWTVEVGAPIGGDEIPPLCAAPVIRDGDQISFGEPTWLWCTELDDAVCGTGSLEPRDGVLEPDQLALVGWVLQQFEASGELRQSRLYGVQNRIWCITDGRSAMGSDPAYGAYVDGDPTVETCDEYREWLDANVLPGLPRADDTVTLVGPGAPAEVGTDQVFVVTSDVAHLTLSVTGAGTVVPCDDTATLVGDDLQVVPGQPTELCASAEVPGELGVDVSSLHEAGISGQQYGFLDDDCQVFVTSGLRVLRLEAAATATFTAAQVTTTTSTTSTTVDATTTSTTLDGSTTSTTIDGATTSTTFGGSSTTLDGGLDDGVDRGDGSGSQYRTTGELARTGGDSSALGIVGALLLLVGAAVLAARRRLTRAA